MTPFTCRTPGAPHGGVIRLLMPNLFKTEGALPQGVVGVAILSICRVWV